MEDVRMSVGVPAMFSVSLASASVGADGVVHGTQPVGKSDDLEVVGQRSVWDLSEGTVHLFGDVIATRGPFKLACEEFVITYDGQEMEKAVATGGVTLTRDGLWISGASATLTVASGEVVVTGNPTVVQGDSRLTGRVVTVFLDDDRVVCDTCRIVVGIKTLDAGLVP